MNQIFKIILAEKNQAALMINQALFGKRGNQKYLNYKLTIFHEQEKTLIVSTNGHLVGQQFPPETKNWYKVSGLKLLEYTPSDFYTDPAFIDKFAKFLKGLIKETSEVQVLLATDNDQEGELIGYDFKNMIVEKLKKEVSVKRIICIALDKKSVLKAFEQSKQPDLILAEATKIRHKFDLIWGFSMTRASSINIKETKDKLWPIGRVQTPVLGYIFERENEINSFKPVRYDVFQYLDQLGNIWENEDKDLKINLNENIPLEILEKNLEYRAPEGLNTTDLLKLANSLRVGVDIVMKLAETLYLNGYISYPRTDTRNYLKSTDFYGILGKLKENNLVEEKYSEIITEESIGKIKMVDGVDHEPCRPTGKFDQGFFEKEKEAYKLYLLIKEHFLKTISQSSLYTGYYLKINSISKRILKLKRRGWLQLKTDYEEYREFIENKQIKFTNFDKIEKETTPPRKYSQSCLIGRMEKEGLGTKSTRSEILKTLVNHKYVDKRTALTEKGNKLCTWLIKLCPLIFSPQLTQKMNSNLNKILTKEMIPLEALEKFKSLAQQILVKIEP